MINLGKWRWLVVGLVPCGVMAGFFLLGGVRLSYVVDAQLTSKGKGTQRVSGEGRTPSEAVRSAESAAAVIVKASLSKQQAKVKETISAIHKRQAALSSQLNALVEQQESTLKGSKSAWTPQKAQQLATATARYRALASYPTHTDLPILAAQIKSLEAQQRGRVSVNLVEVTATARKINETLIEAGMLASRVTDLKAAEKRIQADWKIDRPVVPPQYPARVPGWPLASVSAFAAFAVGCFLIKGSKPSVRVKEVKVSDPEPVKKISLELATDESAALPDDPLTRKAAALYERWLALVEVVYTPGAEAPKDIYVGAEPLFKETAGFLEQGHENMTRLLARVVKPGDLFSHVARTVLMALMGAYEAGASAVQQQGMTFAALFHDLAVVPRDGAWDQIGSEVGRLSSSLLRKVPGIPTPLLATVEEILIAMDEYPMPTWQNVPRNEAVQSFAKLLGHIDRFDKVMQKQKTRIDKRIAAGPTPVPKIA